MNTAKKWWGIAGASIVSLLVSAGIASAQQTVTLPDPLGGSESFNSVVLAVTGFLFWDIAVPLSTIMVLVGAFQFMTAAGDPEKVTKARKTITYAAVGFALAVLAGSVSTLIQNFVAGK
jgi:hypothetical protein